MNDKTLGLESIVDAKLRQMTEKYGPCRHDISIICLEVMGEIYSPENKKWIVVDDDYWSFMNKTKKVSLKKKEIKRQKREGLIATGWHDFLAFLYNAQAGEYPPIKEELKKHVVLQMMG